GEQCAEFGDNFAHLKIDHSIFDIVRPHRLVDVRDFQFQAGLGASHLIAHGLERVVVILRNLSPCGRSGLHRHQEQNHPGHSLCALHCRPPVLITSCAGGGRIGGRSVELSFFCTSNSEVKIAGEAAATGTDPDSAPQYPLNTSGVSPVATILVRAASGVPTISTPRTSSSGLPSA